jgi:hypothetical protein
LDSRIIWLVKNTAEDTSATLSPQKSFVNVAECSSGLLQLAKKSKADLKR